MGWFLILAMALIVFAALWRLGRMERGPLQFLGAALLLALAGYAWQGSPDSDGAPRAAERAAANLPPSAFAALRRDMFGGFDRADRWLTIAESMERRGKTAEAAGVIRSGLRANPRSATLWTGYANALVLHGDGVLGPAAELAYRRAGELAPQHPGPRLFFGAALAEAGRFAEAEAAWREAHALAPPSAPWREGLAQQLRLIEEARKAGRIP
jgi:cytochrome c-type biogenesis protein CcmH/NrfG